MQPIAYLNSVCTARVQIGWLWRPDIMWLLLAWECMMLVLVALFPVAMLESAFGMLALPMLLCVLAPNHCSTAEESEVSQAQSATSSTDGASKTEGGDSRSLDSTSSYPQLLEIGVHMRSLFSCLGLIFAINLLPLFVQVSSGLIEACTVVMFVVLGHLLLSKTALVHANLKANKSDKAKLFEEDEPPAEPVKQKSQPEPALKQMQATPVEEAEDDVVDLPQEEKDDEEEESEEAVDESEETDTDTGSPRMKGSKLVWADVEEDEFQHTLARNQPDYTVNEEREPRPAGSQSTRSPGSGGKRRKDGGKGGGKGSGNHEEKNSVAAYTSKIRTCGRNGDLQGALAGVEEAIGAGLQNTTEVQNALLYALVHCGDKAGTNAAELFEKMKEGKQADVVSFNIILRSYLDIGEHDKAKELLQEMADFGISANKVTLNELLGDRVKASDHAGMWRVIDEMRELGFGVTNVACSLVLKALKEGTSRTEVKKSLALLEELVEPMDEALCSSAIEACLRVKELELASDFMANLGNIKAKSKSVGLSPATYGSMIKAHGQARDLEQTWATWNAMFKNGTSPSAITFGCMVESLVMNGAVDDAWKLVHEMLSSEEHSECVNTVIYSTVMKGFSHARRPDQCFAVLDEMRARGVEANTITYNTLLDACAKCSAMARVPHVFEEMKLNQIEPDKITYSTLIKGYCLVGDLDCAFDLFEEMQADGKVGLDEIVYNALIDGCGRQQKVQRAMQVLADMRKAKIAPSNYTLSILVKLLGRAHKLNDAIALVEDFRTNYRVRPNVQVYTCLMQACLLNKRVSHALTVYNQMVEGLRCLPDQKAYSVLLNGCVQAGALKEAVQVARCAYLLPGKDLVSSNNADYPIGVEPHIMSTIDRKIHSASVDEDTMRDWQEVMSLSGCTRGSPGGSGKGKSPSHGGKGKGKGKDGKGDGKGYRDSKGYRDGKGSGRDRDGKGGGKDGKGYGKSRGKQ